MSEGLRFKGVFEFYTKGDAKYVLKDLKKNFDAQLDGKLVTIQGRSFNPEFISAYLKKWRKKVVLRFCPQIRTAILQKLNKRWHMKEFEKLWSLKIRELETRVKRLEGIKKFKERTRIVYCSFCNRPIEIPIDYEIPNGVMISCGLH